MRPSPARAAIAALAIATGLGLATTACTKEKVQPAAPPSSAAPGGGSPDTSSANSVPPGVSGQGSQGGDGLEQPKP